MDFRPMNTEERQGLADALRRHGRERGGAALLVGPDTSFAGTADDLPDDNEVITAIMSTPTHYAG